MKACPERALLLQGLQEEEEEDGGAFEGLKQEEEVEDENGPFVVVKLEEEQAACSARCSGSSGSSGVSSAAAEAKMELELSLFAPVESDEEEQQRLQQRSLTGSESDSAGAPVWRSRGARERAGQTEGAEFPQKRPRGRPRRQKKALGRRGRPRKVAAGGESRMEVILEADEEEESREHAPPQKRARSMCWDFSPTKVSHSGVWEHFEYFINPDGEVEDDGFPTCKICQQKVACKRGNTSNMLRHLQDYHTAAYYKAKKADAVWTEWDSSDSDREMKMEEDLEDMEKQWHSEEEKYDVDADDDDVDYTDRRYPKSPRQKRQVRSAVWQYFVYSNDDDANKERVASCKICGWKVSPGSSCNTSNMRYHLQAHHQIVCPVTKTESTMASQRTYTAKEVLAILTNVDSCESDGGEELSRTYEITSDSSDEDTSCASDEVIQSPPRKRQTTSAPSIRAKDGTVWEKVDITRTRVSCLPNSTFSEPAGPTEHAKRRITSRLSSFLCLVDIEMLRLITECTVHEAHRTDRSWSLSVSELMAFIAVLFLRAVLCPIGAMTECWSAMFAVASIKETMPRDRYQEIMRYLRFDNKDTRAERAKSDKFAAISDIWQRFVKNCNLCYNPGQHLTVDEQLFPTKVRCPFTQYISSKPDKFGVKFWVAFDLSTKYMCNAIPYLGKDPDRPKGERVSENVVMKLMKPYLGKGRTVATDNYFTSLSLANRLLESNTTLLGTINKIRREIPLEAKNAKGREKLSTEVYRSDGALLTVYAPKTNKTVCVLSTMHTHVKIADDRKRKPNTVTDYNRMKCAVDIMGQKVRAYTVRAGTRRWPVAVFYNLLDLAAMNAHVLYTACTGSTERRRVFLCALAEELRDRYLQEKELGKTPHPLPAPGKKTQCQPGIPTSIDIPLAEGEEQLKLFPPKNPRKSGVWKLFGFVMNTEGVVEENGFPICRLCHQVVASKDGNTSNMHSHLQRHHQTVYAELKHIIGSARPEHRLSEPAEIHPPVKHRNSPVWKYFGFIKNAEGMVKEDGFALCRLCLRKVAAKDGTTSNMLNHLRRHHQAEYEEVKLATDALPLGSADDGSDLPELFPPTRLPLSPVWDYFGYPKNADGVIEENEHPKCKACRRSIISRQGILSNMLRHLKFHHNSLFAELKLKTGAPRQYKERVRPPPIQATPEELHPPKIALKSAVWKYFGYLKNSDGVVVPDGFPVCKLCLRKVSTQRGSTTNMMVHLQNYHQTEFAEMKLSGEDSETGEDGEIPGQAENTDQQSILFPPRDLLEPVWEHFGYQKDADGTVQVDGHPLCKICGSKVSCEGENTQFLYRHLWKKHKSVYYEVKVATNCLREEDGHAPPALYPPTQRVKSVVWEYFGYLKDANGTVVCDGFPICKICQLNVAAKGGNTTNLFKHLQDHHKAVYEEIRPGFSDEVVAGAGTSSSSSELSAPNAQINSKLWDYFESPKNAEGTSVEEGPPTCKICDQTLDSSGDTTSNMMKHLQESHEMVYAEVQAAIVPPRAEDGLEAPDLHPPTQNLLSRIWEYFGFLKDTAGSVVFDGYPICRMCQQRVEAKGGDTTNMFLHLKAHHLQIYKEIKPATEKKIYKASELSPPNGEIDSRLWDHFGYPKNADGVIEDDGAPVCKLCLQKLTTASKSATISSNMMRHLRKKHELVYNEVQEALTALRAEGGNDSAELHPPTQNVTSPVWEYFGYLKDAEGLVVSDGFPICKMCQKKVASKGGNTTNMFKHLKDYHRTIYDEIRSAVTNETLEDTYTAADLHLPSGQHDSPLWEHFGYRKDAEGILQEDGAPYCKICLRKLISKGETTRNMRQHLKENHSSVYTEPEEVVSSFTWETDMDSSNLCPPTHKVKSAVWKFFGYPKDAEGSVVCNGFPICKLCQKKVSAKGGNTTNMFSHLRDYHRPTYDEIKAVVIPARAEADLEPLELHLPTADAMSPVWKYFGYPKNSDGTILCDGFPICRICQKKVLAKGDNTTNMLIHLRAYHLDIYKEVKSAVAKKVVYRPFELFPPNSQNDIKLWDHFGYPKNADGVLQDDGAPICKICLRKLMKASGDGTPTTNMLRHLRKKHQSVFDEVQEAITALRTEWGIEPPELHPPTQNVTSPVWEYFGYLKDAEGSVVCDDYPICKLCQQKVASKGRCTTNMFKHLKDYHRVTYDEIRSAVTNETFEDVCMPTDLHPPSGPYNPKLWEYFGYRKSEEGVVEEDGAPICKLCFRKLISKGETTANMMQHLKENHNAVYADVQREVNPFTIGGATELPDLHPPEHRVRSAVWKYFGYLRDTEGPADCAGYPICKICLSKVSNKGKVTANMTAHLRDHHKDFYDDLKIPEKKEKVVSAEELPELFPPNKQPLPPIWEYFGLTKNIDGSVEEDGSPICKICARKVSSQDPRRMIRHLQFCHFSAYEEFKKANRKSKLGLQGGNEPAELCPPSKQVRSFVWEYFGYPKNPDGTVNVDGRPVCKTCFRKVSSQGGNTTNMLKHLEDKHGFSQ
uniref:BED-type domain-containing protein n=1 Tax=Pygocentrus nattereri TaxID=42514 RepID=A0AAR2K0Y7_PYGNA